MKLIFCYIITFLFFVNVNAGETSSGQGSEIDTNSKKNEYVPADGNCPSVLKKWIDDDISDNHAWGAIKFASEYKTCEGIIKTYRETLIRRKESTQFSDSADLGRHFSQKYKDQIHPSYQDRFLKDCDKLSAEKSAAIQTKFYVSSARIEAANSTILDEVSYYDSVLPKSTSVLNDVECTPVFPENNKKCLDYKTQARSCEQGKQKRFDNLVVKTKKNLLFIQDLERAYTKCVEKKTDEAKTACEPILQAIEVKKNETPWVRGEIFQKITVKSNFFNIHNDSVTDFDFSENKIETAMQEQMSANRKSLSVNYKNNLENFRCLSSSVKSDGEPCDFKKIRTDVSALPVLDKSKFLYSNPKDFEARTYLDAEICLSQSGERREKNITEINNAGKEAALGLMTLGVGSIATGIRSINAASKVARGAAVSTGILGASLTTVDLKRTYESCSKETKLLTELSGQSQVTLENICSDPKSSLSQAREMESDCFVNALLTGPSVLPFVGAIPSLAKLTRSAGRVTGGTKNNTILRSAKSAKNVELDTLKRNSSEVQKAIDSKDLGKAKNLIKEDMLSAGHNLDDKQLDAILKAHTHKDAACVVGQCTPSQLAKKVEIMKEAGIGGDVRRAAIERGWAGRPGDDNLVKEIKLVDGNTPTSGQLTSSQVAQIHLDRGLANSAASSNQTKAQEMIAEFKAAAKAEREAVPLTAASGGNEANTIKQYDLLHKDFSNTETASRRVLGGDHENLAEDISNLSEHMSTLKNSSTPGSVAGKEYKQLIEREMNAMANESKSSLTRSRNKDYPVGEFEAWQYMRARVELARHNMENGKMSEEYFEKIADELTEFVQKNKLENKAELWKKAQKTLKGY